jgi:hypothetical protein
MPSAATTIASHVCSAKRLPPTKRDNKAVKMGPMAMVISTLATVVIVKANMKAVNITDQQTPDNQKLRASQGSDRNIGRPLSKGSKTLSETKVKKLRQKVTSKPWACVI